MSTALGQVRDAMADIVGAAHVREASADADAVAGVVPSLVVSPGDEAEVSAVLACATREGTAVVTRGGGTKLDWGAPPRRCDVVLSTARLDAVVEHEPGDLVCVVQPGLRLAALQEALAPHRQGVMLDPGHRVAATVGGIVAAGAWGPLRTRYGTARDLVIGMRFVLADGTVGHSGGKVVKNVAGYDIGKLLIGSLGTLGVITEVALRLHPLPRVSRTVQCSGLTPESAAALWEATGSAAGAVIHWPERVMTVQIDGTEGGVAAQVDALRGLGFAPANEDTAPPTRDSAGSGAVAVVAVPRASLTALLQRLSHAAVVLPSLGIAEVRLDADEAPHDVLALRAWAESLGGHLTVRNPTPALAAVAWPQDSVDPVALDLMRSVKRALDPTATLSPGRHLGGI